MVGLSMNFHVDLTVRLTHSVVLNGERGSLMVDLMDNLVSIIVHRLTHKRGADLHGIG